MLIAELKATQKSILRFFYIFSLHLSALYSKRRVSATGWVKKAILFTIQGDWHCFF